MYVAEHFAQPYIPADDWKKGRERERQREIEREKKSGGHAFFQVHIKSRSKPLACISARLDLDAIMQTSTHLKDALVASPYFSINYKPGDKSDPEVTSDNSWMKTYHLAKTSSEISIKAGNRQTQLAAVSGKNNDANKGRTELFTKKRYRYAQHTTDTRPWRFKTNAITLLSHRPKKRGDGG
jgi:hypothetical protein